MSTGKAPLYEQLLKHRTARPHSFHVPGHKLGKGIHPIAEEVFQSLLEIDMTEIPGLDDLHHPEEAIKEAQELAAAVFGSEHTHFLVGGSTVGNLAMIMATCQAGDLLLVQRNAHKSVIHGLMLSGARAVFITPKVDPDSGLPVGLTSEQAAEALERYPEAKGLLVTNPSYYGLGTSLQPLAELLHKQDKVLLVDEAHGAHYGLHPALPLSAMGSGADGAVQSTHKMLTSMTMGAMLHLQGDRLDRKEVARYLGILQSSSPSYPIMASLDVCRMQMQEHGRELLEQGIRQITYLNECLRSTKRIQAYRPKYLPNQTQDPFKILLYDAEGRWTGFELKERLEQLGCYPEMADPRYVLMVCTLATTKEDMDALLTAIRRIEEIADTASQPPEPIISNLLQMPSLSEPVFFHRNIRTQQDITYTRIVEAKGQVAAEMIIPYPPGIPLLYPGEIISEQVIAYLERLARMGSRFHGHDVAATGTIPTYTSAQVTGIAGDVV
jgi:arginine decarboxylase